MIFIKKHWKLLIVLVLAGILFQPVGDYVYKMTNPLPGFPPLLLANKAASDISFEEAKDIFDRSFYPMSSEERPHKGYSAGNDSLEFTDKFIEVFSKNLSDEGRFYYAQACFFKGHRIYSSMEDPDNLNRVQRWLVGYNIMKDLAYKGYTPAQLYLCHSTLLWFTTKGSLLNFSQMTRWEGREDWHFQGLPDAFRDPTRPGKFCNRMNYSADYVSQWNKEHNYEGRSILQEGIGGHYNRMFGATSLGFVGAMTFNEAIVMLEELANQGNIEALKLLYIYFDLMSNTCAAEERVWDYSEELYRVKFAEYKNRFEKTSQFKQYQKELLARRAAREAMLKEAK